MITRNQIDAVTQKIIVEFAPEKIILFGSYAHGTATGDSDLDLLIIKDNSGPLVQRNRDVRKLLREFMFPVDVIIKTTREFDTFKDIVGTVVYSANKYGQVLYG
jgi:predicted nucleotidyltransferase